MHQTDGLCFMFASASGVKCIQTASNQPAARRYAAQSRGLCAPVVSDTAMKTTSAAASAAWPLHAAAAARAGSAGPTIMHSRTPSTDAAPRQRPVSGQSRCEMSADEGGARGSAAGAGAGVGAPATGMILV